MMSSRWSLERHEECLPCYSQLCTRDVWYSWIATSGNQRSIASDYLIAHLEGSGGEELGSPLEDSYLRATQVPLVDAIQT